MAEREGQDGKGMGKKVGKGTGGDEKRTGGNEKGGRG